MAWGWHRGLAAAEHASGSQQGVGRGRRRHERYQQENPQPAKPGRRSAEEVTLFKSLGLAVEDVATADLVYGKAVNAASAEAASGDLRR